MSNATAALAAGVEGKYGEADSVTATLTVGGTPSESVTSAGLKIGTIRITVS